MNQVNALTKVPYQGENQTKLEKAQKASGFQSNEWFTFLQAKQCHRKIKPGSHGVGLGKVTESEDEKGGKHRKFKRFVVFNLDQTDVGN